MASADTILRRVRAVTLDPAPSPRVVGIDEWALRKGQRYGTIIVDLERHRPIDLLPEYAPEPIAKWFEEHPGIEVIARDRASIYTEALAKSAPGAQQVADRWHLTHNLGSALQELLARHTSALRDAARQLTAERMRSGIETVRPYQLPPAIPVGHIVGPPELRHYQFTKAKHLHAAGWSYRRIAQELQINWRTAAKYVQVEEVPRRVLPQATSSLTPHLGYIRERWAAGCQQGTQLLVELKARGYRGSLSSVYRLLKAFRTEDGRRQAQGIAIKHVKMRSPRQAMWLLVRDGKELSDDDLAYRTRLCLLDPVLGHAAELGQRLLQVIRERQETDFDRWLVDAEASNVKELVRFAQSLRRDELAVRSALTTIWSNEYAAYCTSSPT